VVTSVTNKLTHNVKRAEHEQQHTHTQQ